MIRILIADDQALIRAGFSVLLDAEPDLSVVGEASTADDAVQLVRQLRPDLVLMDIRMPGGDGLSATQQITSDPDLAGTRVVMLTTFELDEYVFTALKAGASGFLGKSIEPDALAQAIRTVHTGESLLSPSATTALIRHFHASPQVADPTRPDLVAVLTERETEVVALVATGLSNDEIAAKLYISPLTAKTHVTRAMTKLHARDRAQLVVLAYQSGLVSP
ncbi:MAG: response regulator [Beutenbergiaceae bacterium]